MAERADAHIHLFEGGYQNSLARQAGFSGPVIVERADGTGGSFSPEEVDTRILQARRNLEKLLRESGLEVEA